MTKEVLFSGIQPTNHLTLGNYVGALNSWQKLQDEMESYFCVVNLHAISTLKKLTGYRESSLSTLACYLAAGIDPEKSTLFIQSQVPEHAELGWVLTCFSYMGELSRMTQYKSKSETMGDNIPAGLFNYPSLQAADILLYQTDIVPVGEDQRQHIELTRNIAERVNRMLGKDLFKMPKGYFPKVGAKIYDLQNPENKMSKSAENEKGTIFLLDPLKKVAKKIKSAVTDSGQEVSDKDISAGLHNLFQIQSVFTGKSINEIHQNYIGKQYGVVKVETADIVCEELRKFQERYEALLKDESALLQMAEKGAQKAREKARQTLQDVYDCLGFLK